MYTHHHDRLGSNKPSILSPCTYPRRTNLVTAIAAHLFEDGLLGIRHIHLNGLRRHLISIHEIAEERVPGIHNSL